MHDTAHAILREVLNTLLPLGLELRFHLPLEITPHAGTGLRSLLRLCELRAQLVNLLLHALLHRDRLARNLCEPILLCHHRLRRHLNIPITLPVHKGLNELRLCETLAGGRQQPLHALLSLGLKLLSCKALALGLHPTALEHRLTRLHKLLTHLRELRLGGARL